MSFSCRRSYSTLPFCFVIPIFKGYFSLWIFGVIINDFAFSYYSHVCTLLCKNNYFVFQNTRDGIGVTTLYEKSILFFEVDIQDILCIWNCNKVTQSLYSLRIGDKFCIYDSLDVFVLYVCC